MMVGMVSGRLLGALAVLGILLAVAPPAIASSVPGAGCPMFPGDSWWHADISDLPVDPASASYVASMGASKGMHADFGSGLWDGGPIGIPYVVVNGQPGVSVSFGYDDQSDHPPGGYPIPANPPIEGGAQSDGDRHVLIVDAATCNLYELYAAYPNGNGTWSAGSGAVWNLNSNALRPDSWTSADAAGLPILPGLVRYDEVAAGYIDHAIRITANATSQRYLWPARHQAGSSNPALPPMGLRLRLNAGVDISGFPRDDQVILQAMKTFGVVVADNGSSWYVSGVPDERWDDDVLHALGQLNGSAFEAVDASSLEVSPDSGQAAGGYVAPTPDPQQPTDDPGPAAGAPAPTAAPDPTTTVAPDTTTAPATTTTSLASSTTVAAAGRATVETRNGHDTGGHAGWFAVVGAASVFAVAGALVRARRRQLL
jgi:hypothetical protein